MYVPKGDPPRRAVARTSVRHSILGNPALATRLQPASHRAADAVGDWARQPPSRVTPPAVYTCHPPPGGPSGERTASAPARLARLARDRDVAWLCAGARARPSVRAPRRGDGGKRRGPRDSGRRATRVIKIKIAKKKQNILRPGPPGVLIPSYVPRPPAEKRERESDGPPRRVLGLAWPALALPWLAIRLFLRPSFLPVPIARCHLGAEHTCPRIKLPMRP